MATNIKLLDRFHNNNRYKSVQHIEYSREERKDGSKDEKRAEDSPLDPPGILQCRAKTGRGGRKREGEERGFGRLVGTARVLPRL